MGFVTRTSALTGLVKLLALPRAESLGAFFRTVTWALSGLVSIRDELSLTSTLSRAEATEDAPSLLGGGAGWGVSAVLGPELWD